MMLEERANDTERLVKKAVNLGIFFVFGWVSCQNYYHLAGLWNQRNALERQVVREDDSCRDLRRIAVRHMIEQQDEGLTPDWSSIKPCPKLTLPPGPK